MRKIAFYSRLALSNLLRNRSTYLPYLLAAITSIFTFYTMLAINFNAGVMAMRGEAIIQSFTAIGTVILALFCTVLLFYTNSFLIKRRKKELGLYSILGMEKHNIGIVLFFETLFIAFVSLVIGLAGGALLARLLFLALLHVVRFPVRIDLPVSFSAMGVTSVLFLLVFLLTFLRNLRQVRQASPIALLAGSKEGEKEPRASWVLTIFGVLCLAGGYAIALAVQSPIEALLLFLLAALLVIIGTFCLFTSGSVAFLKLLRRNKNYYYNPKHFISVSGMIYRMKQNAAGLASICILSCMVLVTVSSTVALYVGAEDALYGQYPHEFSIEMYDMTDADTLKAGLAALEERHTLTQTSLRDYRVLNSIASGENSVYSTISNGNYASDMTLFRLVPLEDYNRMENTNVTLGPGEALVFSTGGLYSAPSVTLDNISYTLRSIDTLDGVARGRADIGPTHTLILPDLAAVQAAYAAMPDAAKEGTQGQTGIRQLLEFELEGTEADKAAFLADLEQYAIDVPTVANVYVTSREAAREDWFMTHGGFLFLGIYFGVLFLLAAAMIIYYKQISEGYDDCDRYVILQKVGMSADEVRRTISGQIRSVFFLPLLVAVVHIAVASVTVSRALLIFGVYNTTTLFLAVAATVLLYIGVYALVYRRTAKSYFKIVRFQA